MWPFFGPFGFFGEGASGAVVPPDVIGTPLLRLTDTAWINRVSVERMGMRLVRAGNWLSSSATAAPEVLMAPGMTGGQPQRLQAAAPLQLELETIAHEADVATRVDHVNRVADALRGLLEIRFADAPTRALYGTAGPVLVQPLTPKMFLPMSRAGGVRLVIPITCHDSARYALSARQIALSTTPAAVRTGTLPAAGEILLFGALTGDCDVDCYAPSGQRLYRLALTDLAIETGGHLRIRLDLPRAIIAVSATGTQANAYARRDQTSSSRWWMVPSSVGDAARGAWCTLVLSTGTGLYRYTEAWEH